MLGDESKKKEGSPYGNYGWDMDSSGERAEARLPVSLGDRTLSSFLKILGKCRLCN